MTTLFLTRRWALIAGGGALLGAPGLAVSFDAAPALPTLLHAIRQGRGVRVRYGDGATGRVRTLAPLRLSRGWNGALYVEARQLSGPSRSGVMRRIKTFRLDRMADARPSGRVGMTTAPTPNPPGYIRQVVALRPELDGAHRLWLGHDRAERYHPAGRMRA